MKNDIQKNLSLIQELELGIETVKSALSLIQSIEPQRTPIFLIFIVLSTGLERIFKILIGLRLLTDEQRFLSEKEMKMYGHDLCKLKEAILSSCFDVQNLNPPIIESDYEFISNNSLLNELLKQLSEFAKKDRYIYMNRITNSNVPGKWLGDRWSAIEERIIPADKACTLILGGHQKEYKKEISNELVKCIEQLLGVLVRTITFGKMNKQANSVGTLMYDFLHITKADLGKRKYELFGFTQI